MGRTTWIAWLPAVLLLTGGCVNLAPEYQRPAAPIPEGWPIVAPPAASEGAGQAAPSEGPGQAAPSEGGGAPGGAGATAGADVATGEGAGSGIGGPMADGDAAEPGDTLEWQAFFTQPRLREVIALALANNRDLRLAALNIQWARAQYRIEQARDYPDAEASASLSAVRTPRTLNDSGTPRTRREYGLQVGFAAFELDLFGRIHNLQQAALEQYLATGEARRAAHITLTAEVAGAFLTWAADHQQLTLARQVLANREALHGLTVHAVRAGTAAEPERYRTRAAVDAVRGEVALLQGRLSRDRNALTLLLGTPLPEGDVPPALEALAAGLTPPPPGLPGEVLLCRPDVRQAEHALRAAHARIGAARAALFPSLSLTTALGSGANALSALFDSGSGAWTFAPSLGLSLFPQAKRANLEAVRVEREQLLVRYEEAIRTAFREVADALAQQGAIADQLTALTSAAEAADASHGLAELRFRHGVDARPALLEAQYALLQARQALLTAQLERAVNRVTLYKVLGGGVHPGTGGAAADDGVPPCDGGV